MTIAEMHGSILLRVDETGSFSTSKLLSGEIDDYINEAIEQYVNKQKRVARRTTPESTEAMENLRTLETDAALTTINTLSDYPNGHYVTLPADYNYYISSRIEIDSSYWKYGQLRSKSYVNRYSNTYYNTSLFLRELPVWIADSEMRFIIGEDDTNPNKVLMNYISNPQEVDLDTNTDCDLPEHTHRDIIDIAVNNIVRSLAGQNNAQQENQGEGQ